MAGTDVDVVTPPEEDPWEMGRDGGKGDERGYTRAEVWSIVFPTLLISALAVLVIVGLLFIIGPDDQDHRLDDLHKSSTFTLDGAAVNGTPPYGPHVWAYNLTLDDGDVLSLTYASTGPPGGIQVRLQHPVHPTQGGPVEVHTSAVGANGSLGFEAGEAGAYQIYFYHPGAFRPPDDGDAHQYATVTYSLKVVRVHRP